MKNLKREPSVILIIGICVSLFADIVYEKPESPLLFGSGYEMLPAQREFFDINRDDTIDFTFGSNPTLFTGVRPEGNNQYLITPDTPPNIGGPVKRL
ncbi:MAG: hypothetical protein JXR25_14045, partial [Pontiellaceae bacterium]|nr:hypothetical protein [Pontiellaceae bacterium]